jgi:hypothetical protein
MRKSTKLYLTVFLISFILLIAATGALVFTGTIYHRESHESISLADAAYTDVKLNTNLAVVTIEPNNLGDTKANISLFAWRGKDFNAADYVQLTVENGTLILTEIPFPMDFFGFFPQPYGMNITLSVPQAIYDSLEVQP